MTGEFGMAVQKFCDVAGRDASMALQGLLVDLSTGIVLDTPVDTGLLRGNWQFSTEGIPSVSLRTPDKGGLNTLAEIQTGISKTKAGGICYLANNLVYAYVVEYGLFPNPGQPHMRYKPKPAKMGVRTTPEGYSTQSPMGMVRTNIQKVQARADAVVAAAIGNAP